jgi:hypothetical protein
LLLFPVTYRNHFFRSHSQLCRSRFFFFFFFFCCCCCCFFGACLRSVSPPIPPEFYPEPKMAMPILVCLGTTAVLELRRMALRGEEGRALDELRASEQKLTKIVQVGPRYAERERSLLCEKENGL